MTRGRAGAGVRLALTTFTIAPLRPGRIDRDVAGVAMSLAPLVGAALGAVLAGAALGLRGLGATPLLAAAVTIGFGALLTRGLHLDGLADTADGLGSYRDAQTALAIMKRPDIGPFGVIAIVVTLLVQTAALTAALARPWPAVLATVVAAVAAGRLAAGLACRRGVPSARPGGLGALVAQTVRWPALVVGAAAVALAAVPAVPDRPWQGPLAVGLSLAVALLFTAHVVRRIGGITGDVLGATLELSTTAALLTTAL